MARPVEVLAPRDLPDHRDVPQPYRAPRFRDGWQPENEWGWEGFPEFVPFLDAPPLFLAARVWYDPFLKHLATYGEKVAAAMYARIGKSHMYRAMSEDPVFAEEVAAASEFYRARCRHGLVHNTRVTGNPVGLIVDNKANEPAKYIEKNLTVSVNLSTDVPMDEMLPVLRAMLADASAPTKALLGLAEPGA